MMPDEKIATPLHDVDSAAEESTESFSEMLAEFEHSHTHKAEGDAKQLEGTVVSLDAEFVYLDIGYKTEGILARTAFANNAEGVEAGNKFSVSVKGRNVERYYELSLLRVAQATDWASLQEAFASKTAVVGTVTGVVKGGLTVDVGVRAFMPASRSGTREAGEMEKLVGQQITCRITKLDTVEEDVVVDRRAVLEEEAFALQATRLSGMREGEVVTGTVRSFAAYGAFVDLGGVDGLLHISDMAWSRVKAAEDVLSVGQQIEVKVLSVDPETKRISLGLKQLQPEPWDGAAATYAVGQRITGTVTRLMDFGAFVELEPGIEGLIHVSEMSWVKKVRKPSDMLKEGDSVEAVVLAVDTASKRISLGLKQALGDPWTDVAKKFVVGSQVEGPVTRLTKFGAFVELAEGVEGLVHVSEIVADRRINHPQDVLRVGERVKAQVVAVDAEKRQIKLSMKQLVPTGLGEYLEEHKAGDTVSGRVVEQGAGSVVVELGEGIRARCTMEASAEAEESTGGGGVDLSQLGSMLSARWKGGADTAKKKAEPLAVGQVRSFQIVKLDAEAQTIELKLA
ncbi:MAG TPA: 30S ribosomal protein S1 [Acidobacteriaceae bacterium]|nr:30S ribosomal protein S1 [Acidobacteriaceae bacterium]